jgi:hypothetical protein
MENQENKTKAFIHRKSWWNKDVNLNVSPAEALIRLIIAFALPMLLIWFQDTFFIVLVCVVSGYLFMSVLMLFCFVKYCWRHYVVHKSDPKVKDPNIPVEKL